MFFSCELLVNSAILFMRPVPFHIMPSDPNVIIYCIAKNP